MKKECELPEKILELMRKGVKIPAPWSVDIGDEVKTDNISGAGVVLYGGSRIFGGDTVIGPGTELGHEAPATVIDCQTGANVRLRGGFFQNSVFLDRSNMGLGAHVREGCILEEEANGAHTVGLKQTILFPFVTLGSLINFCDCLMAGGTSRNNHSEVGSSYIHFNYTPNQDKATPSLIGDVPRGVMLNQPPIFLGGQGGLVGPLQIGYGTALSAGTIYRNNDHAGGKLLGGGENEAFQKEFFPGFYGSIRMKVVNNVHYIANLLALKEWYAHVRKPFFDFQEYGPALYRGARTNIFLALEERIRRFETLAEKMETSIIIGEKILKDKRRETLLRRQRELMEKWPSVKTRLTEGLEEKVGTDRRDLFINGIDIAAAQKEADYIGTLHSLDGSTASIGVSWLQAITDEIIASALKEIPSYI